MFYIIMIIFIIIYLLLEEYLVLNSEVTLYCGRW